MTRKKNSKLKPEKIELAFSQNRLKENKRMNLMNAFNNNTCKT